jgi:hypothetical protein
MRRNERINYSLLFFLVISLEFDLMFRIDTKSSFILSYPTYLDCCNLIIIEFSQQQFSSKTIKVKNIGRNC